MPLWEEATLASMTNVVFDTLPLELEYVQGGYISGLVGQKYWGWGYDTVQMVYEVSVPSSNAATIEEMCASPKDTVGFIPALGYVLANGLCGVKPGLASERYGWNVYWTQFIVPRDSDFQTFEDLEGATWAYPDATSTSGYLYSLALFDEIGITVCKTVEAGGHSAVVKAIYNGEADFFHP